MTGTRNPSRLYFRRNQPYFFKSVDNWDEWDTDESYNRTVFIGIDDTDRENVDVALYMIWGGKPVNVVGAKIVNDVTGVVENAKQLEQEIQSILEEVQKLAQDVAQSEIDIQEATAQIESLVERCKGILEGAEAARDLAKDWANKMTGTVDGTEYSAKYYANEAKSSASTATEQATAAATSANQAATSASTAASYASSAHIDASGAANSAKAAASSESSAHNYSGSAYNSAGMAESSATNAANSATDSANSASASAASAQAAQNALDTVNGLIATPIGTIFMSIYVDESLDIARQLNGQLISSTKFTGFRSWLNTVQTATPNLFTTETNWQAEKTNSKLGQCGKFVVDDTAGTIRLPCVVNAQGLVDLALIGTIKSESLPNIRGTFNGGATSNGNPSTGAFYWGTDVNTGAGYANAQAQDITGGFDASRSSSTYQDNAPVQQEAVQYPYYIQVATGIEETLPAIREYKINTPFFFGQSMYSENDPYNASWLESNGQYNASTVYPDFWTQLTGVELNTSLSVGDTIEISGKTYVKRGLSVKLSTDTYDDYDFVINTVDQTFRLPLLNGSEDWVGSTSQTISTADIVSGSPFVWTASQNGFIKFTCYAQTTQVVIARINNQVINHVGAVVSTTVIPRHGFWLKVKKGDVASLAAETVTLQNVGISFIPAKGNGTLYYYVGDTVQDASLINAGAVLGQLANKADIDASNFNADGKSLLSGLGMPSNRYIDLTLGASGSTYTAPANGYVSFKRQGNQGQHIYLSTETGEKLVAQQYCSAAGSQPACFIPVRKGQSFICSYDASGPTIFFHFIYAEGDK